MKKTLKNTTLLLMMLFAGFASSQAAVENIVEKATKYCDEKWGPDSATTVMKYSLYREFYKQKNYKDALTHWRYVFFNAPACRQTTHINGTKMYEGLIKAAASDEKKAAYTDTLIAILDVRAHCFEKTDEILLRKGYYFNKYRKDDIKSAYETFEEASVLAGNNLSAAYFVSYITTAMKADKKAKIIDADKVLEIYEHLSAVSEYNILHNRDKVAKLEENGEDDDDKIDDLKKENGNYLGAIAKVEETLDKNGYLNCETLLPIARSKYAESPDDEATLVKVYNMLKGAKCYDDPLFLDAAVKLNNISPNAARSKFIANKYREMDNMDQAMAYYNQAADLTEDNYEKADIYLGVAKIYRSQGNFSQARTYANKSADLNPSSGEPYMLIGNLYASSGSKCGPGTGFESQVVAWAAVDMFQKAKNLDSNVADEAQRLINKYSAYFPAKEETFMRGLSAGSSYTVGCWMNVTTRVR